MSRLLACLCVLALFLSGGVAFADEPPADPPGAVPAPPPPPGPPGGTPSVAPVLPTPPDGALVLRAATAPDVVWRRSPWQGQARLRYRLRSGEGDTDQDLYGYLKLKYRDECESGLSGSFHGRLSLDLDDFEDATGFYVFDSITDTYDHRLNGRVYHLYANYRNPRWIVEEVRLGRMYLDAGEYFHFDGMQLKGRPLGAIGLQPTVFVGVPSHLFESSPDGEFIGGLQLAARPWRGAEAEVSYVHVRGDNNYYGDEHSNLFEVALRQRIGRTAMGRVEYQHLDGEPRLLRAAFDATFPRPDLVVRGTFNTLFNPEKELVYDLDAYYAIAQDLAEYWDAHLSVSKGIGDCFSVEGGWAIRQFYEEADEARYNREFSRYYANASAYDLLLRGLDLTVGVEYWDSDPDDDVWTVVFDADYRPSKRWRIAVGTDYSAYRFDLYADEERQSVYGGFARVSYAPSSRWRFDVKLRLENDEFDTYVTLDASARFQF